MRSWSLKTAAADTNLLCLVLFNPLMSVDQCLLSLHALSKGVNKCFLEL